MADRPSQVISVRPLQVRTDAEDAARYRGLRSEDVATNPAYYVFWQEFAAKLCREGRMDDLIDAAMGRLSDKGTGQ
jgi:hypothetical protein